MRDRIWTNNALLHPLRALKIALRNWLNRMDENDAGWTGGEIPKYLEQFHEGELLPWKGLQFKIGKIVGGDHPCLIIVPTDRTHGAKLQHLRRFRDHNRRVIADRRAAAAAIEAQAPR